MATTRLTPFTNTAPNHIPTQTTMFVFFLIFIFTVLKDFLLLEYIYGRNHDNDVAAEMTMTGGMFVFFLFFYYFTKGFFTTRLRIWNGNHDDDEQLPCPPPLPPFIGESSKRTTTTHQPQVRYF